MCVHEYYEWKEQEITKQKKKTPSLAGTDPGFPVEGGANVRATLAMYIMWVTPSAACPLNRRLRPLERYKRECGDHWACGT